MRGPRRDGAERRSRRVGREKHNGGGDRGAAVRERWRRTAIKVRGRFKNDGGGEEVAAAEDRWR